MTLVYSAGRRVWRVRVLLWLSLAFAVWFVLWGVDLYNTYGLRPADGGVLASPGVRIAWLVVMSLIGLACLGGMWFYVRVYVAALWFDEAADRVAIHTAGWWQGARIVVPRAEVRGAKFHDGHLDTIKHRVRAPWYTMRVDGYPRAFIVDAQGAVMDDALLQRVLRGARRRSRSVESL